MCLTVWLSVCGRNSAAPGITGLPERSARRVLNDTIAAGLLASTTPKGPVSLRFPDEALEKLFPKLYPQT